VGQGDFENEFNSMQNDLFGGVGILGKMLNSTMKMLEKELQKEMQQSNPKNSTHFELFINGKKINPSKVKVIQKQIKQDSPKKELELEEVEKTLVQYFNKAKQQEFTKLKKTEPSTNVRRLADKVIYELTVPGVKSIDDVSIVPVGESIEVKAIANEKAYFKSIPVHMPVKDFYLQKEKLVLELKG